MSELLQRLRQVAGAEGGVEQEIGVMGGVDIVQYYVCVLGIEVFLFPGYFSTQILCPGVLYVRRWTLAIVSYLES